MVNMATMRLAGQDYSYRGSLPTPAIDQNDGPRPLVVALHGGFYTSAYFDVPGRSLVETARCVEVPLVALDRPGYGDTSIDDPSVLTHDNSAAMLDDAIEDLWNGVRDHVVGVVLIGHSIGASIALRVAARATRWPVLGVAVSGIGLRAPERGTPSQPPSSPTISIPPAAKKRRNVRAAGQLLADHPRCEPSCGRPRAGGRTRRHQPRLAVGRRTYSWRAGRARPLSPRCG